MQQNDSFVEKLFDPAGRNGRMDFFLAGLVPVAPTLVLVGFYTHIVNLICRWHDLGKSRWMALLNLILVVWFFVFLYLPFFPPQRFHPTRKFTPNPYPLTGSS